MHIPGRVSNYLGLHGHSDPEYGDLVKAVDTLIQKYESLDEHCYRIEKQKETITHELNSLSLLKHLYGPDNCYPQCRDIVGDPYFGTCASCEIARRAAKSRLERNRLGRKEG
jgi:hypothetical protein